jgi:hypothetical protein
MSSAIRLEKPRHVAPTESLIKTLDEAGVPLLLTSGLLFEGERGVSRCREFTVTLWRSPDRRLQPILSATTGLFLSPISLERVRLCTLVDCPHAG